MKIAVTGKGGVGKTSMVALLGSVLQQEGKRVLYIDADPDMNLATVLQVPEQVSITPIVELKELIAERTGVEPGQPAPLFKMNPKVDDIPDTYCVTHGGFKLMVMGTIKKGGGGCACPENAFLKSLLAYLVIARDEWVLLDMEAGIEHLGRGTAIGVDHLIIVVEPNRTSIETAHRIRSLSADIKIKNIYVLGNQIQDDEDREFLQGQLSDFPVLGYIGYSREIRDISLRKKSPGDIGGEIYTTFRGIIHNLEQGKSVAT
jgi:CO dehydrogenase maturation factor